jgi:hypothetical protein
MCRYDAVPTPTSSNAKRKNEENRLAGKRVRLSTSLESTPIDLRNEQRPRFTNAGNIQGPPNNRVRTSTSLPFPSQMPRVDFRLVQTPKPPSPSKHSAGLFARVDQVVAQKDKNAFQTEVVQPIKTAFTSIKNKCIICILRSRPNWDNHSYDDCPSSEGVHNRDGVFRDFKEGFKVLPTGWCWACMCHQKDFLHGPIPSGQSCPNRGHLLRVAYAYFSLDCPILNRYPNAPFNLAQMRLTREMFTIWALGLVKPEPYNEMAFTNLHHLFLWAMKEAGHL